MDNVYWTVRTLRMILEPEKSGANKLKSVAVQSKIGWSEHPADL